MIQICVLKRSRDFCVENTSRDRWQEDIAVVQVKKEVLMLYLEQGNGSAHEKGGLKRAL